MDKVHALPYHHIIRDRHGNNSHSSFLPLLVRRKRRPLSIIISMTKVRNEKEKNKDKQGIKKSRKRAPRERKRKKGEREIG